MRLLYLDFDGPMHPSSITRDLVATPQLLFNLPDRVVELGLFCHVTLLAELLVPHPDVGIVVHSNWRQNFNDIFLCRFLGPLAQRFVGVAPREEPARHAAIVASWIALQAQHAARAFCVLDDDVMAFPRDWPPLLACDPELGLGDPAVIERLFQWLEATRPPL